jgi:hypothetical protein
MPYIKQELRESIDQALEAIKDKIYEDNSFSVGDLNYAITSIIDTYLECRGLNYGNINSVIGVTECLKLELYRRVAANYEDQKAKENGDVYKVLE